MLRPIRATPCTYWSWLGAGWVVVMNALTPLLALFQLLSSEVLCSVVMATECNKSESCRCMMITFQRANISDDATVRNRLTECIETILNKAQEPPKSKKVQHSNAKNAILFEAINLVIHMDCDSNLLIRACNQLGQFLQHRETNLRYSTAS